MTANHKSVSTSSGKPARQPHGKLSRDLPSSHGDSPHDVTPKDITPQDATWEDRTARNLNAGNEMKREEARIDEAIELTFPASDPVAELPATAPSEKKEACNDNEEILLDDAIEMTFPASDPIAVTPVDKAGIPVKSH